MNPIPKKKIIFYGDISIDIIVETTHMPQIGQDASVQKVNTLPGGSSANSAVVASQLNVDSYYMGLVGDDIFHDLLIQDLKANHVKLDLVKEVAGKNTFIIAIINEKGERTFFSYRGINGFQGYGDIAADLTKPFDCVHISGYCMQDQASRETAYQLIEDAQKTNTIVTLDPSFLFSSSDYGHNDNFLANFDIVIPNLEEARFMANEQDIAKAARIIRGMGPEMVVIKMAKDGCFLSYKDKEIIISAYPIDNIVNTIGAGDAFCAGFLSAYLNGLNPEEAARIGNAAAHIVILGDGGHNSIPTYDKVQNLISSFDKVNLSK